MNGKQEMLIEEIKMNDAGLPVIAVRRVVLLDDHMLYRNGIINSCITPFFENIHLIEFMNGDTALEFVKNEIYQNKKIDLIITDINHPGIKGDHFVQEVRNYEKLHNSNYKTPIVIISMVDESYLPGLFSNNFVCQYISKEKESAFIINCLKRYL